MNNIQKLTLDKFQSILQEEFESIFKEDNEQTTFDNNVQTINLDPVIKSKMDEEIKNCLLRGTTKIDYNLYKNDAKAFEYFTNTLASIVVRGNNTESEKANAKRALMEVFSPYGRGRNANDERGAEKIPISKYFSSVMRFSKGEIGANNSIYFVNDMNTDNMISAFIDAFEATINKFNPDLGKSFHSLLTKSISRFLINTWAKQNRYQVNGEKVIKKTDSLDAPIDPDDSDAGTVGDTVPTDMSTDRQLEKNRAKKLWGAINTFIKRALSKNSDYVKIYDLYTNEDLDLEEIAEMIGQSYNNVRVMKMRAEDKIYEFIKNGALQKFVQQTTGEKINIPFVTGKGTSKERFIFPRLKTADLKESYEFISLNEGIFVLNLNEFNNEKELVSYDEVAEYIINEVKKEINSIDKAYNSLISATSMINEGMDVDTADLYVTIKSFVEKVSEKCRELGEDLHEIYAIADGIGREYPKIAELLEQNISPIIEALYSYPNKLIMMADKVRLLYNPKRAFGIDQ